MNKPMASDRVGRAIRYGYAAVLMLYGLTLLVGGLSLAVAGGSLYNAVAGIAVALSAVLIGRRHDYGALLYILVFIFTLAWAAYEVGFDLWGLVARLAVPFVLGLPLLIGALRGASAAPFVNSRTRGLVMLLALLGASLVGYALHTLDGQPDDPLWQTGPAVAAPGVLAQPLAQVPAEGWRHFGNDRGGTRFSPLGDINTKNVHELEIAWEADVGPSSCALGNLPVTPLSIGLLLYTCAMVSML